MWLDKLYYDIGRQMTDFRLLSTFIGREGEVCFTKWVPYLEAQADDEFMRKCNQREQLKNEIVFDLDGTSWKKYLDLIERLNLDGIKFYAYATKSHRARHIHTYWRELPTLPMREREQFRSRLLSYYGCDLAYASDRHPVPIENCRHWKTGEWKNLMFKNSGWNILQKKEIEWLNA